MSKLVRRTVLRLACMPEKRKALKDGTERVCAFSSATISPRKETGTETRKETKAQELSSEIELKLSDSCLITRDKSCKKT